MPNEQWRDELQEYALLVEAVASGDRSKVVKLFGDYILRKKEEELVVAETAEDDAGYYEDGQDPEEEYGEEHDPNEEYNDYYQEDEDGQELYDQSAQTKRVRFADETEYYEDENDLANDDQYYGYNEDETDYYGEDYDPDGYNETEDGGPYMSGALPSGNDDSSMYYEEGYGDDYNYGGDTEVYENENELQDNTYGDGVDETGQYENYYGQFTDEHGLAHEGYYDPSLNENAYGYNMNQGIGGEWNEDLHQNEQVTDDQVQENGVGDEEGEIHRTYPQEYLNTDGENDLYDLLSHLQQGNLGPTPENAFPELTSEEEIAAYANDDYEDEEENNILEEEPYRQGYGGLSSMEETMIDQDAEGYGNQDELIERRHPEVDTESVYDDEEVDEDDLWDDEPANEDNFRGYSDELDQLQRQYWDEQADIDDESWDPSAAFIDSFPRSNEPEISAQNYGEEGFWNNPVRPHFDDIVQFPSFSRTRSNEKFLPYPLTEDDFGQGARQQPAEPVDPHYNVFDGGQRFYDHYSNSCDGSRTQMKRVSTKKARLYPRSLVDRFRDRLQAN